MTKKRNPAVLPTGFLKVISGWWLVIRIYNRGEVALTTVY